MRAGTVELVSFACAARPRRLVKGKVARAGRERGPWRRARFPRVCACACAARCLYPRFCVSRGCRCRHVRSMRIADARELRGVAAEAGAGIDDYDTKSAGVCEARALTRRPGKAPRIDRFSGALYAAASSSGHCHGLERRAIPGRCDGPPAGADWCLDTPENLPIAPGLPERRALARLGGRAICECPLHPTAR